MSNWEKVSPDKPLGRGGKSTVYLVRRPERTEARERSFAAIKKWSGQDLSNRQAASDFSRAVLDVAREDHPHELGALKVFHPRGDRPEAKEQAVARLRSEIAVLRQGHPGLVKLLDENESERWIVTEYCHRGTLEDPSP